MFTAAELIEYPELASSAKRLDTNPLVREAGFEAPEGLFALVLEGQLKTDAVVEADWPAIGVPSVTLWGAERYELADVFLDEFGELYPEGGAVRELELFAPRHLVGVPTAVIAGSDFHANDAVRKQTGHDPHALGWASRRRAVVSVVRATTPVEPTTGAPDREGRLVRFRPKEYADGIIAEVQRRREAVTH